MLNGSRLFFPGLFMIPFLIFHSVTQRTDLVTFAFKFPHRKRRSLSLFCLLFLLAIIPMKAQLVITPNVGAAGLVNALAGRGLTISNVQLTCDSAAYGTFSGGASTNLGFNNGILLTTGSAVNAIGPNDSIFPASTCVGTSVKDSNLVHIDSAAHNDPCILQFDIVPQCNTLTLRFVFGSGEYPTYVGSYNDAFGFFITGPNPTGPAYNGNNIALLPNGTPVSINTVNNGNGNSGPCTNCTYYVNNSGGATIQYAGMTTVLTVSVALVPCATYHFKVAIADAGDCLIDSGVFVDFVECSTSLNAVSSVTPSGCTCSGSATVTTTLGFPPYTYSWIPSGNTTNTLSNICAGTYTCIVKDGSSCGPGDTVRMTVPSTNGMTLTSTQTNVQCNGGCTGSATATPTGGVTPFTYSWSPGGATTSTINGLCAGLYTCNVTDAHGCAGNQVFTIMQAPALHAVMVDTLPICTGAKGVLHATATGGTPVYTIKWSNGINGSADTVKPAVNTYYKATITDSAGCTTSDSTLVVITPKPTGSFTNPTSGCSPYSVSFTNNTTGGTTYLWNFGDSLAHGTNISTLASPTHVYADSGFYNVTLIVSTSGGCPDTVKINNAVHVFGKPNTSLSLYPSHVSELTPQISFFDTTHNAISCVLYFGDGDSVVGCNPGLLNHTYADSGRYTAYVVSVNALGCRDTQRIEVFIDPLTTIYVPNAFTPNGDQHNPTFRAYGINVKNFELMIFDRWGQLFFDSHDITTGWDGTMNGHPCPQDVYVWRITYKDLDRKPVTLIGHVTLLK